MSSAYTSFEEILFSFLPFKFAATVFNRNRPKVDSLDDYDLSDKASAIRTSWERPNVFDKSFNAFWRASRIWRWFPLAMAIYTFIFMLIVILYGIIKSNKESASVFVITRAIFLALLLCCLPFFESRRHPLAAQVVSAGLLVVCMIYLERFLELRQCLTAFFASTIFFRLLHFRTIYDNFALCVAYTANIGALAVNQNRWYLVANVLVWSSFIGGILLNYICYRVLRRVYENLHGLYLIREKTSMIGYDRRLEYFAHISPAFDKHSTNTPLGGSSSCSNIPRSDPSTDVVDESSSTANNNNLQNSSFINNVLDASNHNIYNTLLEKSNAVLIALKVDRGAARDCILSLEREQRLFQILDNHAANLHYVKVRNFGSTWVLLVGFRRSEEEASSETEFTNSKKSLDPDGMDGNNTRRSSRHSLHSAFQAMRFCAQAEYFATQLHLQVTIACDFGAITAGFVTGSAHMNVFGQEIRWVLKMVDLENWGRIIISEAFRQQLNNVKKIFSDHSGPLVEQHAHGCMWKKGYVHALTVLSNPGDYFGSADAVKVILTEFLNRCERSLETIAPESSCYELFFRSYEAFGNDVDVLQQREKTVFTIPTSNGPSKSVLTDIQVILLNALYGFERSEYWLDGTSSELKKNFFERIGLPPTDPIFYKLSERDAGAAIYSIEEKVHKLASRMMWRWPRKVRPTPQKPNHDNGLLDQLIHEEGVSRTRGPAGEGLEQCYSPVELLKWKEWRASFCEFQEEITSSFLYRKIIEYYKKIINYLENRRRKKEQASRFSWFQLTSYRHSSARMDRVYVQSEEDEKAHEANEFDAQLHRSLYLKPQPDESQVFCQNKVIEEDRDHNVSNAMHSKHYRSSVDHSRVQSIAVNVPNPTSTTATNDLLSAPSLLANSTNHNNHNNNNTQEWLANMNDDEIYLMRQEPKQRGVDFVKYSNDLRQFFFHAIPNAITEILFFVIAIIPLANVITSKALSDLYIRNIFFLSFLFSQTIEQAFPRYGVLLAVLYHIAAFLVFPCDNLNHWTDNASEVDNIFADFGGDVVILTFTFYRFPSLLRMHPVLSIVDAMLVRTVLFFRSQFLSSSSAAARLTCTLLPRAKSSIVLSHLIILIFFALLYYQTFLSYIVEHMLLPRAKHDYKLETTARDEQLKALYPQLPLKEQSHLTQVAVYQQVPLLCIHVKAFDVICEMVECRDMAMFTTALNKIIDQCLVEAGMIKVTEFSGVFVAIPGTSIGAAPDNRMGSDMMNCAINAVGQVQTSVAAFCSKYHFNVPLGISLHCGDVFVGFIGNDRYCFDVCGLTRDMAVAMACYNGDGIFTSSMFEHDINRIKPVDYLVHQQTVLEPNGRENYWLCVDGTLVGMQLDDFNWICKLGEGGYGIVHLAAEKFTKVRYAIKVIPLKHGRGSVMSNMIKKECIILQRMSHRNVVKLHYSFIAKEQLYLVMSYIKGGNLKQIIDSSIVAISQLRNWFAELILAIEYIHSVGIIHRDIKPANCMIDTNGHLKLADFGLSKMDSNNATSSSSMNNSNNDNASLQLSIESEHGMTVHDGISLSKAVRRKLQKFLPLKMIRTTNEQNTDIKHAHASHVSSNESEQEHRSLNILVLRRDAMFNERKRALRFSNFSIHILSAHDETEADTLLTLNHVDAIVVELANSIEEAELFSPLFTLSISDNNGLLEYELDPSLMHIVPDETALQACIGQVQRARDLIHYFCKKLFNTIPVIAVGVPASCTVATSFLHDAGAREVYVEMDITNISEHVWRRLFSIPKGEDITEEEYSSIEASVDYTNSQSLSFTNNSNSNSLSSHNASGGYSGKSLHFEAKNKDSISTLTIDNNRRKHNNNSNITRSTHLKGLRKSSISRNNSRVMSSRDVANPMLNSQVEQEQIIGTLHFIAPEVIQRQCKSGIAVDWWACGLTFFYCLTKRHYFRGEDKDMVFQAILHDPINVLDALTADEKNTHEHRLIADVVQQLVCRDVYKRLSSVETIKKHPFFEGLDWNIVSVSDQNSYKPSQYLPKSGDPNDKAKFYGEYESQQQLMQIQSYQNMYSNLQEMDMRAEYSMQRYAQNRQRIRNSKKPMYSRVYGGSRQYKRELSIAQNALYSAKMKKLLSGRFSSGFTAPPRKSDAHSFSGMSFNSSFGGMDNMSLYFNDVIQEAAEEDESGSHSENRDDDHHTELMAEVGEVIAEEAAAQEEKDDKVENLSQSLPEANILDTVAEEKNIDEVSPFATAECLETNDRLPDDGAGIPPVTSARAKTGFGTAVLALQEMVLSEIENEE